MRSASAKENKEKNYPGAKRRAGFYRCGPARRRIRLAEPKNEVKEFATPCENPEGGAL
jgi:hypothetical protein